MLKEYIEKISNRENLSFNEAYSAMSRIMSGECNNSQIAGLLTALKTKGETAEEVAGFAGAMRQFSIKIEIEDENLIDVCGTGGDNSNTFNISTATAFVVAGAGVKVAKHGNRSISSKCGSADVISLLGIDINLTPEQSKRALDKIGIAFLFAPIYHPAMKYAAPVRKELGTKTIFNILGPLTNPAGTKKQLIGTFSNRTSALMAEAAQYLNMDSAAFVCTANQYDEITLTDETNIKFYKKDKPIEDIKIDNTHFSFEKIKLKNITSDSPEKNAKFILSIIQEKQKGDAYNVVVANAAMALLIAGVAESIEEAKSIAIESIESGNAYKKLQDIRNFGN
ncbi:anthranilate phosphoribosyltransferase [Melioribacter sp. OK-6-Me]|uniref:anthranilate phosphoribosyltransferase n=1 Tax=unclassified Melioribacter TaxID=2627329 RepID=UPI003ED8FE52